MAQSDVPTATDYPAQPPEGHKASNGSLEAYQTPRLGKEGGGRVAAPERSASVADSFVAASALDATVSASVNRLTADLSRNMNEQQKSEFNKEMEGFIAQAQLRNLPKEEITRTLNATAKLLEGEGDHPLDQTKRAWLALSLMRDVNHAGRVDQGCHNTCNVTAIMKVSMCQDPARAAEMVSSTALNGFYQAPDGKRIAIDAQSLQPDKEAAGGETEDGKRNYATQIFDLVSINNYWQRQHPPFSYVQHEPQNANDTGERLLNAWGRPVRGADGAVLDHPNLDCRAMREIGKEVGIKETFLVANANAAEPAGALVDSPESLAETVKGMLAEGHPAMLFVEAGNKLFTGKYAASAGGEGWHVVTIDGYDPSTGKFHMSNQWGAASDQNVSLDDLYDATLPPKLWAHSPGYFNQDVYDSHHQQMLDFGSKLERNQVIPSKEYDCFIESQKEQMRQELTVELAGLQQRLDDARSRHDEPEVVRLQDWISQTRAGLK